MKVPSGSQTGIKIFIQPDLHVEGGLTTEVILDFNVEKSFVLQGNMNTTAGIKGFHFKPVIRAYLKINTKELDHAGLAPFFYVGFAQNP